MKKLLVLMLVLGIASVATAGLSWVDGAALTVDEGIVVDLVLSGDTTTGGYWLDITALPASAVTITALPNAGGDASVTVYTGSWAGYAFVEALDNGEPFTNALGDQFNVAVDTTGLSGDYVLGADTLGSPAYLTLTVVPEPITMGLLAVGGLFLRRRK